MFLPLIRVFCLVLSLGTLALPVRAEETSVSETNDFRSWRLRTGKPFDARLATDQGLTVILETKDRKKVSVIVNQLSHEEQMFLRDWRQAKSRDSLSHTRAKVGLPVTDAPAQRRDSNLVAGYLTSTELAVIEELNLARTNPSGYAKFLGEPEEQEVGKPESARNEAIRFLLKAKRCKPLKPSLPHSRAALDHVKDIGPKGQTGHIGSDKSNPGDRIARHLKNSRGYGENIAFGIEAARDIVIAWIIDEGVPGRGHRLAIFTQEYTTAGVAIGPHETYRTMCVVDFGK